MLLAIHSSPVQKGNLEGMVLKVAEASGRDFELVRLADMDIRPCKGCVRCAKSRRCVQNDDMQTLYPRLEAAEGLIVGAVNYNGRFNALAHVFLERLFPLYHREPVFSGKPVATAAVGGEEPQKAAADLETYLREVYFFQIAGSVMFKSDTPPCFSCGMGTDCQVGMPALNWSEQEFAEFTAVKKEMFQRFEDNPDLPLACKRLGKTLDAALRGKWGRPRSGGGFYLPSSG